VTSGPAPYLWRHLRELLLEGGHVEPIDDFTADYLGLSPGEALARLQRGDPTWEAMVPAPVAEAIKRRQLFR
jgi:hypothetical protein